MNLKHLFVGTASAAVMISGLFSTSASAADAPCIVAGVEKPASVCAMQTRIYASTCYICHGPNGKSEHAIPGLAGQDKDYLILAMKEQKSGARETSVMRKYMLGYTDTEIEQLAALFANMK